MNDEAVGVRSYVNSVMMHVVVCSRSVLKRFDSVFLSS